MIGGEETRDLVITQIKNILNGKDKTNNLKILQGELVQTGKVPNTEINKLCSLRVDLNDFDNRYLCLIYKTLQKYNNELKSVETYFTPLEIKEADTFISLRSNSCYPLVFEGVTQTTSTGKEFKFILSIQDIVKLSESGILKIVEGMQRESETVYYRGKIESHVSYNDSVAREIGEIMYKGEYHPTDDIKIHGIETDDIDETCEFKVEGNTLTIKKGTIVLLDGQHRTRGAEYALRYNPDLYMMFSVNLTFGIPEVAQGVIEQHERRQPINKNTLATYKDTRENDIFKIFSNNPKIAKKYKFVDTTIAEHNNAGFIIRSEVINAIRKYYNADSLKEKEQREVAKWLVTFFDELYLEFEDDIVDYINVKKNKWNVRSYAYEGFIYMSKQLFDAEIDIETKKEMIPEILSHIDFTSKIKSSNKARECLNIIKKAVDEYVN